MFYNFMALTGISNLELDQIHAYLNIDWLMVIFYLTASLVVGIIAGRHIDNLSDYAIAKKTYSTPILTLTLLATVIGGATTIGMAEKVYISGIVITIASIGSAVADVLMAKYLAPRMARFSGMITVGDIMYECYGMFARILTGISGTIFCAGMVGAQIIGLGFLFEAFFNLQYEYGALLSGVIIITYSTFGGIKSVTITDVMQFALLIVIIPLVCNIAIEQVGGVGVLINSVPKDHLSITNLSTEELIRYSMMFTIWAFPFFMLSPPLIQRFLMASESLELRKILYVSASLRFPFALMIAGIGLSAIVLYPDIKASHALPHIISQNIPEGIKGMAIAGLMAVIMSTADSFLNSGSILFTKDICGYFINVNNKIGLAIARLTTICVGGLAIFFAIQFQHIIDLALYSEGLLASVITIPLIFGILGFKTSYKEFYASTTMVIITLIISSVVFSQSISSYPILITTIIVNISTLLITHTYLNKGIKKIEQDAQYQNYVYNNNQSRLTKVLNSLRQPLQTLSNYSAAKVQQYGANYLMFGIFCCLNYIVPYFMWSYNEPAYYSLMLIMRMLAGFLCVGLLLKDYWPRRFHKYFPLYWHFTLLYCLPFMTTMMLIMERVATEWLINMALAIFLLILLVDWLTFIVLTVLGASSGYLIHKFFIHDIMFETDIKVGYLAAYIVIFSSLIGLLFARRRDHENQEKLQSLQLLGGIIAHEVKTPIASTHMNIDILSHLLEDKSTVIEKSPGKYSITLNFDSEDYKMFKSIPVTISSLANRSAKLVDMILTSLKSDIISNDIAHYNMANCVREAIDEYSLISISDSERLYINVEEDFSVYGSKEYLKHAFLNLFNNAFKHGGGKVIVNINILRNRIIVSDNGCGINPRDISKIFEQFYTNSATGTGIGLSFCKMVMEKMGGQIKCQSELDKYTAFYLDFPPNIES